MKYLLLLIYLFFSFLGWAQTPVSMGTQPALIYTETFDSIINWTNGFTSGTGANRFSPVVVGGTAAIPDPTHITTSSGMFVSSQMAAGGLYKDTISGRMIMLVTGTSNNSNSLGVDLLMDFTGVNAGTLGFDWETVFNGTPASNRTATLKVYATTDNINFTDLTPATVTATNNVTASGSIVNVSLPASFNNAATARLRFYYYNSAGGSTGSRPALALDNIKVTALGNPCTTPVISPVNLVFANIQPISMQVSWTPSAPAPDEYLVVATTNTALSSFPIDGKVYSPGDTVGDGYVVYRGNGNTVSVTGLSPLTAYTFYVFPVNIYCSGTIRYRTLNPLTGQQTTPAGPPCVTPTSPASNLQFSNVGTTSISGSFTPSADASEYLVIRTTATAFNGLPVNGISYKLGDQVGVNGTAVYRGPGTQFITTNLTHSTSYNFYIFSINNFACSGGPVYLTSISLTGSQATQVLFPCAAPAEDAGSLILQPDVSSVTGFFDAGNPNTDGFLVVKSTNSTLSALPQNGISYNTGNTLGGDTIISTGKNYSFSAIHLAPNTTYHFFIFPYNEICTGGPLYKTTHTLQGSAATTSVSSTHFYFGNLHAHSTHSDGNQDDRTKTPYDDYDFAQNAMCMDFLGISEHNHFTATNNPGMTLAEYQPGVLQAAGYTASHPGFLALYGMEWGTLTNGGHSLVYGIDSLIGWETINGSPNYNVFVPKNDFTSAQGLFRVVNSYHTNNAFATLAHPSFNDYQNIANSTYNASADSAIVGIALQSGPAFSTNTSYGDPGSSMEFLPYYLQMLSRGYHVAPMIDHDNHNMTFGRTSQTRTAVIAHSITPTDFMQAMRNLQFYATQDCDTRATIRIYGQQMGSKIMHPYAPAIHISAEDPTNATAIPSIKLMYGKPGSGILPVQIATVNDNYLNHTHTALYVNDTGYYYADITIAGKRIITAPIWYTRAADPLVSVDDVHSGAASYRVNLLNNPAQSILHTVVDVIRNGKCSFTIYTLSGQKILTQTTPVIRGQQEVEVPVSQLPPGMYFLVTEFNGERINQKFLRS
ncbi:MAG TPA: T9SS type A sorting domain-containing protein [Flavipsychrobacter sp.]|nr:T9SS type A sorting domain-containing protein [Flavipsychrobacter sp.]